MHRKTGKSATNSTTREIVPLESDAVTATPATVEKNIQESTVQKYEKKDQGSQKAKKNPKRKKRQVSNTKVLDGSLPTPVIAEKFAFWLLGRNADEVCWIYDGFKHGFRIGYEGERKFRDCRNQKSAEEMPEVLLQYIDEEVALGRMAGPFDAPPFPNMICSPAGLRKKADGYSPEGQRKTPDGRYRTIQNLSFPYGGDSVNSGIPKTQKTVKYPNVQDVIDAIVEVGEGCQLVKTDIKKAYVFF